jgi:solute carrier family 25 (mitochondrial S-adenosylmethionine transporter), member 26
VQGHVPKLLEDVPNMAFKFVAYETLKQAHRAAVGGCNPSIAEDFVLGATPGTAAAAATILMPWTSSRPT